MKKIGKLILNGFILAMCFGLAIFLIGSIVDAGRPDSPSGSRSNKETPELYEWATWDREGEMPNAKIVVYDTSGVGNANYGYGNITGIATNRMKKGYSYVQIVFGLFNSAGSKIGTCMDNIAGLGGGEHWQFDAFCSEWASGSSYRLESVTFY